MKIIGTWDEIKYELDKGLESGEYTVDHQIIEEVNLIGINCKSIIFKNVTFFKNVLISDISSERLLINFLGCTFRNDFKIYNCKYNFTRIHDCSIKSLSVVDVELESVFKIEQCRISSVYIDQLKCNSISISYNDVLNQVESTPIIGLERLFCEKLELFDNRGELTIKGVGIVNKNPSRIGNLMVTADTNFKGKIEFSLESIGRFFLSGKLEDATLSISNSQINDVLIKDFINQGNMKFTCISTCENSSLIIDDADLGGMRLFEIDFNSFTAISICNTHLQDIVYSGVTWCKRIEVADEYPMAANQLREAYKQAKNLCIKQNDKPEELRFYSLEMDSYAKELRKENGRYNDKLILGFNQLTNNHGQTWLRPLLVIIVIIIVMYFPIKVLLGFDQLDFRYSMQAFSEMLECFNPIRKFGDSFGLSGTLKDDWKTSLAKVIDIVFLRIIVGLLIFQMVKAFRKYVR